MSSADAGNKLPAGQILFAPIKALPMKWYWAAQLLSRARSVAPWNPHGAIEPVPVTASPGGTDTTVFVTVRFRIGEAKGAPKIKKVLGDCNSMVTWSIV